MLHQLDEKRRLRILRRYAILDTPPEEVFDRVARMAARHFGAPIGTVTFVDEARQWFKAIHGLDVRETGRDVAFCHHTIQADHPLVVADSTKDPRFVHNPLVTGAPNIRFYAGAPLITAEGLRLGTVSAIDTVPHPDVTEEDCQHLVDLAAMVVHELEMRMAASLVREDIERRMEADQRLRLSVSLAPIILGTLDRSLRYTWMANPPPPLRVEDVIGRQDRDLWPAAMAEPLMRLEREAMATGQTRTTELTLEQAGQSHHYDVTLQPLTADDVVVGVGLAALEVTERKSAQFELARMEARHRAVLDTAADAIVVIDETGSIEHFNPAAERIFGYTADEAVGQDVGILMAAPHGDQHLPYIQNYLAGAPPKIIGAGREVTGRRKDGAEVPLDLSIAEWWHGDKRFFTGIMRDISRRKRADAALRKAEADRTESLALLHTILEGIPDPLFFKDHSGRYMVANKATAAALGAESVIGKTDYDFLPAPLADKLRTADVEVMAGSQPKVVEESVNVGSGETRWFLTFKIPLKDERGDTIGVVGLARDITERRAMIEQLRHAKDQAEAASRAKTSFLAAASHDLRQPVQALVLFTTALEGKLKGHPAAPILGRMKQSLAALGTLLESLLDISKLDAGVVTLNVRPCRLSDISDRLAQEFAIAAKRKGLKLRVVGCSNWTLSDPVHLERVLRNLIENAVRYTQKGGVLLGCRRRGDRVLLQVVDTGVGIPEDQLPLVFQEFHQLGNPERDRTKGLGLGLSIVRRLLDLLGHQLRVASVPGRGTVFTIDLPRAESSAHAPTASHAVLPAEPGARSVLIIDDEAIVRQGLEILLAGWSHRVVAAADAEEAVTLTTRHGTPDVIVADYRLQGGRTGTEAVEAVRRACAQPVPAIIITGDTAPERIAEVQRSGHLIAHKPVSGENLQRLIAAATGGGHATGQHPSGR